ncbi:MAG: peptidylprolyl isomerase [Gemmiger sp.]|uniref:peptidylprolyl isomerase n=1 Tax=Gemmiger sp. TaxID=2049027 RepID=UPI002E7678E6|nr:peptidylprolyl isomerase [Gemmiger sp.]MEE0708538.1 peptidylprolyl isomerase [Gemmiger sp.]
MKKTVCVVLALLLALLCGCGGSKKAAPTRGEVTSEERQFAAPADGDLIAIFTTNLGEVRAVLYPDAAPMAVYNFVGLARTGYYNNTMIWRSQYGFAVQGGDVTGTGTGGSTIWSNNPYPLEADANLKHYAGALCAAFASGGDVTGGNSQFYFVTALPDSVDQTQQEQLAQNGYSESQIAAYAAAGGLPYLDNTDTVFGQVYQGMDVVDAMACVDTQQDEEGNDTWRPTEENTITIESVTISTYPGPTAEELAAQSESSDAAASESASTDGEAVG